MNYLLVYTIAYQGAVTATFETMDEVREEIAFLKGVPTAYGVPKYSGFRVYEIAGEVKVAI